MTRSSWHRFAAISTIAGTVVACIALSAQAPPREREVDRIFERWTTATPGCAVGVATGARPGLVRAYGMADLEHDVRNTPDTVFEAGSVSKQFTAAAVLLLAAEGRLSLDDPARKYIPELPAYGVPLTIRQMLTHTSGLRDWGNIAAIAGWPRTTRVHTHAHVLDIVSRQRGLNFEPGTRWSYSNTGYNLAAVIVSRVSGMPFAEFTRLRMFEPLGMTRTSWRDDYTRIVKGRAIAYAHGPDGFRIQMPFENVHGNGGLLTTVGDLLKWNRNFVSPTVGGAGFGSDLQRPGRFNDDRAHGYALGLFVGRYKGVPEVSHGGATAGYRAFLARYPDQQVSVAVLCNAGSAAAADYAHAVADIYLEHRVTSPAAPESRHVLSMVEMDAAAGLYRNSLTGIPLNIIREKGGLRIDRGPALVAMSATGFVAPDGRAIEIDGANGARVIDAFGSTDTYERVAQWDPTADDFKALVGSYASDETETVMLVAMDGGSLTLNRRPDDRIVLAPVYRDTFSSALGLIVFRRDGTGRATGFSVVQDRVWDLRFARQTEPMTRTSRE